MYHTMQRLKDSRFLSRVDPLVGLHVHFLHEGLAAKLARELLLLEVNLFVAFSAMNIPATFIEWETVICTIII